MADYYIDTGGSGTSPYDTWEKAANTAALAQTVLDTAVAGETIHARGTLTLTAQLDIDQNNGDVTSGFIKFIGYNGSGVNDGTRFIIDGNDAATNVIYNNSMDYWWFENIEVKNANAGDGITGTGALTNVFINCCANNNDVLGFDTYAFSRTVFIRCVAYSNTGDGFGSGAAGCTLVFCRSRNNGQSGIDSSYGSYNSIIGSIFDHNGNDGIESLYYATVLFNCVVDHNTDDGITLRSGNAVLEQILGCRITNHSTTNQIGLNGAGRPGIRGWNYYQNNDGDNIQNGTLVYNIPYDGATTDLEDQADTESGYVDEDDPEDYNLVSDATLRRTAIQIPLS